MSSIPASPEPTRRLRDPRGFTLVELLVALVISTFLVTVIYQMMDGNGRYVRVQAAREEVQQNARAAVDLLASDLRTVPPSAIRAMGPDSIRFYLPRAWGVLCAPVTPASVTAWALFPADVVPTTDVFGRANWGVAVEQTTDPVAHTDSWRFVSGPSRQTAGNPCAAIQPGLDPAQHLTLGFNRPVGAAFATAGVVPAGTQVLLYEEIKYDVAPSSSSSVPGSWVRRMVGRTGGALNMQPMAGPVPDQDALRLSYFRGDGAPTTAPAEVRRINIRLIAQSRAHGGSGADRRPEQTDTVTTEVFLRNVSS